MLVVLLLVQVRAVHQVLRHSSHDVKGSRSSRRHLLLLAARRREEVDGHASRGSLLLLLQLLLQHRLHAQKHGGKTCRWA